MLNDLRFDCLPLVDLPNAIYEHLADLTLGPEYAMWQALHNRFQDNHKALWSVVAVPTEEPAITSLHSVLPVAWAMVQVIEGINTPHSRHLEGETHVFVQEDLRGKGIGKRLLTEVEELAGSKKCKKLCGFPEEGSVGRRLFERCGFNGWGPRQVVKWI